MHTILGAGGSVGVELAKALPSYQKAIRLVSRSPQKVNDSDELFPCDLLDPDQVIKAVEGSEVVYLTVGFPYNTQLWERVWPSCMQNTITACKKEQAKLIFLDNVYMYAPSTIPHMTEEAPLGPASKKGKVRTQVLQMLIEEMEAGNITASVARAADFYGPGISNSVLIETVVKPLQGGGTANWLGQAQFKHSYTYTPDIGKALALLGTAADSFNQTWHMPTASPPLTGREWIEAIAQEFKVKPKYREVGKGMLRVMGLFSKEMREIPEMLYQNTQDYVFDSSKFERRFNFSPTSYKEGIQAVVEGMEKLSHQ